MTSLRLGFLTYKIQVITELQRGIMGIKLSEIICVEP